MVYIDLTRDTIIRRLEKASSAQAATKVKGRLSPNEVAEALKRPNIKNKQDLCDALVGEGILFRYSPDRFISRAFFFQGARILIRLTEEEIDRGILFPGHRFVPLYDRELLPQDIQIRMSTKNIKRTPVSVSMADLSIYYSLFGASNFLPLIASESELNVEVITEGSPPETSLVSVSVFDMHSIYDTFSLRPGDYLVAQLEDWKKGQFVIYPPAKSETPTESAGSRQRIAKWIDALDKGFEKLIAEIPWPLPPDEELARAFFRAGKGVVDKPALHVGGYLEESSCIGIIAQDDDTYLWDAREGMSPEAQSMAGKLEMGLSGSLFEELCARHRFPIPMPYAEACVRRYQEDEERVFSHLLYDIFSGVDIEVLDNEEWFQLTDALEKYMRGIPPAESSGDKAFRRIRDQYIILYRDIVRWIPETEEHFGSLDVADNQHIQELMETAMKCVDALHVLNSSLFMQAESLQALEDMYINLAKDFHRYAGIIYEELKKGERRDRRAKRVSSSLAAEYVVLDVELEGLEPPVYRRLRIPGTMTLHDLHEVLQVSFGWENRHLHTFYVAGVEYTDLEMWMPDYAVGPKPQNEKLLLVEDLSDLCHELLYVYDYGDDWRHHITVSAVLPASEVPEEEQESVICLEGWGAGPPEDCGGLPGYAELVEAVETPSKNRDEEQKDLLFWADDWRPDAFSPQELNQRLQNL
jgi:hypothetical protein